VHWEKEETLLQFTQNTLKAREKWHYKPNKQHKQKEPPPLSFVSQIKQHQSQKGETLAYSHPHKNIWNKHS
jgi:hypothetical protein